MDVSILQSVSIAGNLGIMIKTENAKCSSSIVPPTKLLEWTKTLKVSGRSVRTLLDTGCTKSLIYPKYVRISNIQGWEFLYNTTSNNKTWFQAASITSELEGKVTTIKS